MCSRSRQYQRFEYHQKLLSQKRSYGISKYDFPIWSQIRVGENSEPVCYSLTPYQFENFLKEIQIGTTQTRITPCSEARDVCFWAPGWYQIENFLKIFNLGSPLARWYQFENFLNFFKLVFKKEFKSPSSRKLAALAPNSNQTSQLDSHPGSHSIKPVNLTAILAVTQSNQSTGQPSWQSLNQTSQ